MDGTPPDLPADSFSPVSRDFVAGCLNKIPNLRPTYPMLLQHAWLAPLAKPQTIVEEDEEEEAEAAAAADPSPVDTTSPASSSVPEGGFVDREVGEWVLAALEKRRRGVLGKAPKPALHAAPLDATAAAQGSPVVEVKGNAVAVDA